MISDRGIAAPDQDHAHKMLTLDKHRRRSGRVSLGRNGPTRRGPATDQGHPAIHGRWLGRCAVSPRRRLPAGIRGRGAVFTCTWRDAAGRQYSRKAGDTLEQAEAFKRRIDDQLALGDYRPTCTTTFATYAESWIEVWPLKDQTRERYRGCAASCCRCSARCRWPRSTRIRCVPGSPGRSPDRCRPAASASTSPCCAAG